MESASSMLTCPSRKLERMRVLSCRSDDSWYSLHPKHDDIQRELLSRNNIRASLIPWKTPVHSKCKELPLLNTSISSNLDISVASSLWSSTQNSHTLSNRVEMTASISLRKPHRNAAMSQNTTNGTRFKEMDVRKIDSKISSSHPRRNSSGRGLGDTTARSRASRSKEGSLEPSPNHVKRRAVIASRPH